MKIKTKQNKQTNNFQLILSMEIIDMCMNAGFYHFMALWSVSNTQPVITVPGGTLVPCAYKDMCLLVGQGWTLIQV